MAEFTRQSGRWIIYSAVADALQTDAQLQGLALARNPRSAQHLAMGDRLLVIKWGADSLVEHSGSYLERRKFRLIVGSLSRKSDDAEREADAIHQAAIDVVRRVLAQPLPAPIKRIKQPVERDTTPDVDGLETDGALIVTAWEIDYEIRRAE